ncbi:SGNH/GDSL hydrolase family protein [Micromonospora lupini]|uniref:SGNH/GDSL hydrolase family protein n=1 Tax=Micromonospora lupini TaxID=285679 RepID=UPI002250E446|nr:SGNH/GDSL hydrolase family protein [Micromonospora lupini]MCX5066655.1 SGNH/GDSL hydrolase family protein [Micromonospora lupini]
MYLPDGRARARGYPVPMFLDEGLSTPADVLTLTGDPIPESTVMVDAYSRIPLVLYPVGADTVWTSINGGPAIPLYSRVDYRIDVLAAKVGTAESGVESERLARVAQIAAEQSARAAAITAEQQARVAAVTAEQQARQSADAVLGGLVDAVEGSLAVLDGRVDDLDAAIEAKADEDKTVEYLDVYNGLFGGNPFVVGQATTATTLTAPASAGATTLTVASATGMLAGVLLATNQGTASQQILKITGVAGSVLTVTPAVATALNTGAAVAPVWTNASHVTFDTVGGSRAYGWWLANSRRSDNTYVFFEPNPRIVWLGDSWTAECIKEFRAELTTRLGSGTTVVDAGISGNTLVQMMARFAADVAPANPDIVVLEYGVNDIYSGFTRTQMAADLERAVAMCRAIGARVVIPGIVPLSDYPTVSRDRSLELKGQATSAVFPAATTSGYLTRIDTLGLPLPASTTTRAPLNIPHGAAPTSPVDGDMWTTTAGLFVRINGATVGPLT